MGSLVSAKCKCGFTADTSVGGGRRNFGAVCEFPCLCTECQSLVTVNLLTGNWICPSCGSSSILAYDTPSLSDQSSDVESAAWDISDKLGRRLILTRSQYLCPHCTKKTLRFELSGLFD